MSDGVYMKSDSTRSLYGLDQTGLQNGLDSLDMVERVPTR